MVSKGIDAGELWFRPMEGHSGVKYPLVNRLVVALSA